MIDQPVANAMTRSVLTVTGDQTASDVAGLFAERGVGSAIVVGPESDDPVGIVTESDVMRQVASGADVSAVTVDSFMSAPVATVDAGASIHAAAAKMRDRSIRRLLVVDGGDAVGMLTTTDLTHYMPRLRNAVLRSRGDLAGQ